jgi:hypothetical protein
MCMKSLWWSLASYWPLQRIQWNQFSSSHSCASKWPTSLATFVHMDLHNCTHVFLRQDITRLALEPRYSGPYQTSRRERKHCSSLFVASPSPSADTVLMQTDFESTTFNPSESVTPATAPPPTPPPPLATQTTLSGRHVHFPAHFTT